MIVVIDYGMGNLLSVQNALTEIGFSSRVSSDPDEVDKASGLILPGVGAFADAMENLRENQLDTAILDAIRRKVPFLGICLGFQLLFTTSYENGVHAGLGAIPGDVARLPRGQKVPHMGWNQVDITKKCRILAGVEDRSFFYFVHSYFVVPEDESIIVGITEYGRDFASVVETDNLFGVQFHPEKSSDAGLQILKNFGELVT